MPTPHPTRPLRRRRNTRFRKAHVFVNHPLRKRWSCLPAKPRVVLLGPFGEPLTTPTGVGLEMPFRFSTKYQDAETGLYSYIFRPYDPFTGRWVSRDPIEEEGGVNLYGMVNNNPPSLIDPLGLFHFEAKAKFGHPFFVGGELSLDADCVSNNCFTVKLHIKLEVGVGANYQVGLKYPGKIALMAGVSIAPLSLHTERDIAITVCKDGSWGIQDDRKILGLGKEYGGELSFGEKPLAAFNAEWVFSITADLRFRTDLASSGARFLFRADGEAKIKKSFGAYLGSLQYVPVKPQETPLAKWESEPLFDIIIPFR